MRNLLSSSELIASVMQLKRKSLNWTRCSQKKKRNLHLQLENKNSFLYLYSFNWSRSAIKRNMHLQVEKKTHFIPKKQISWNWIYKTIHSHELEKPFHMFNRSMTQNFLSAIQFFFYVYKETKIHWVNENS